MAGIFLQVFFRSKNQTSHAISLLFFSDQIVLSRRNPAYFDQDTMITIKMTHKKIDSAQILGVRKTNRS